MLREYLLNEVNMLRERGYMIPWTEGGGSCLEASGLVHLSCSHAAKLKESS